MSDIFQKIKDVIIKRKEIVFPMTIVFPIEFSPLCNNKFLKNKSAQKLWN